MGVIARPHTYPEGKVARASHANANEVLIYTLVNGNMDWDNIKAALVNVANGILKLNADGAVSLGQIPTVLTGKRLESPYGETINIAAAKELQHNSTTIVNTSGKVLHAVYM